MIPKLIHQTWKTSEIPSKWVNTQKSLLRNNPDYEYILWTDSDIHNFMKTKFPHFYVNVFLNYKQNQQVDIFRYFLLYVYGGIYIDLDIGCNSSFDKYLIHDLVLSESINYAQASVINFSI